MTKKNIKTIVDEKLKYIIKTLSRTKRKDYENYVINAIWNRLGNNDIEIVSQQYIKKLNGKHYFIDLYFPKLNIGIECDEAHHEKGNNKINDKIRNANIFDVLHGIGYKGYKPIHINVAQKFSKVEMQINNAVDILKNKINETKPEKWQIESAKSFYKNKGEITIFDKKGFKSINETCNILFSAGRSKKANGPKRAYFKLPNLKNTELADYKLWFPKLAVIKEGKKRAVTKNMNNQINSDGTIIEEYNEKDMKIGKKPDPKKIAKFKNQKRIVFAYYKDPLGTTAYKFVGIFMLDYVAKNGKFIYKRISETCPII